ncbi:MAG TPA: hypothetical protein VFV77_02105, partial [Gammaproteobacteria bacterium]|nr:hypothetical protein [Gammaproteobacteria bacterium]
GGAVVELGAVVFGDDEYLISAHESCLEKLEILAEDKAQRARGAELTDQLMSTRARAATQ